MTSGFTRREVLAGSVAACALGVSRQAAAAIPAGSAAPDAVGSSAPATSAAGPFVLPKLPYALGALAPVISARTMEFHYGKHHRAYVDRANELVGGNGLAAKSPEEIVRLAAADPSRATLFDNAAQAWNHSFYWRSMKPRGGGEPTGALLEKVKSDFGSTAELRRQLVDAGVSQFGSGWAWLVLDGGRLKVIKTSNAGTPLTSEATPLLTVDVWEHAYYLDHQNRRKDYLTAWVDKLVDWEFARANLPA